VEIVSNAKAVLLYAHLDITEPGGGVYPLMRHKAGVTFGTFYGVIRYSVSGQHLDHNSDRSLGYRVILYLIYRFTL
jgi:hypothetical protein